MSKSKLFYMLCFCSLILNGCWDIVNIEDRGFVVGNAIDVKDGENVNHPELTITNQMVLSSGMTYSTQGSSGNQKAFLNFTETVDSIYKVDEEIASISSKVPFYEHLALLIISENVGKEKHLFSNLLDTYIRDVNLRRGIKVVVSEGEAKKILDFTTPEDKLPATHVDDLLKQSSNQVGYLKPITVGDIEEFHLRKISFVLPYLTLHEYVEYKSGAIFHGPQDKMVGIFNPDEMTGLELLKGEQSVKIIDFPYKDKTFVLKVIRLVNKMTVDPKNIDDIKVTIDIELEGIIKESFNKEDLTEASEIEAIQNAVSDHVKETVHKVIRQGQDELGADVFGVWQELETKHYHTWKKIKDDWEQGEYYFKDVNFDVNVITQIYSIGTSNKTK